MLSSQLEVQALPVAAVVEVPVAIPKLRVEVFLPPWLAAFPSFLLEKIFVTISIWNWL